MQKKTTTALALCAALLASALTASAQGYKKRDMKKAEKLTSGNTVLGSLPEDERQAVLINVAKRIRQTRLKVTGVDVVSLDGKTTTELDRAKRKDYKGYRVVIKEGDKTVPVELITNTVDLPEFGRLFPDNEWDVLEGSDDAITLRGHINKVVALAQKTGGWVAAVHIESSASTLRNRGKAAYLTHLELSKRRAESAATFVRDYLASKDVSLSKANVTMDYAGENKNGTSGESSPFPCPKGVDKKYCPKGNGPSPSPDCVAPEDIRAYYDSYKYVRVSISVVNESEIKDSTSAHMVLVSLDMKRKTKRKPPRWKFPPTKVKKLKHRKKRPKGMVDVSKCKMPGSGKKPKYKKKSGRYKAR